MAGDPQADTGERLVVEQEHTQQQHQIVQERIIRRRDDADLERGDGYKAGNAKRARQPEHPHKDELDAEGEENGAGVVPVRPVLHIPPEPCRQRAVLVVLVHRREIAPVLVATGELHDPRLEVNPEPFPAQHEEAEAGRRVVGTQARAHATWCEPTGDEARLEQHPVRLVHGELLKDADAGQEQNGAEDSR